MKRCLRSQIGRNRRPLINEPLEARRVLAASLGWDGPGLGSAELTYTVGNAPSSLSQSEVDSAIQTALNAWASVADISFTEVNQTGLHDSIDITFKNIDGRGGILAQAYFPDDVNRARIAGDIEFDVAEVWEVGNSRGNQAFDLTWVAAHEIGHALGLDHSHDPSAVLGAYVSPNQQFVSLDNDDIAEIRGLYAASPGNVTSNEQTQPPHAAEPTVTESTDQVTPNETAEPTDNDTDNNSNNSDSDDSDDTFRRWRWWWRWRGFWRGWGGRATADTPANQNAASPTDGNDDGSTSAVDALVTINHLNRNAAAGTGFYDVNGGGTVSAADALMEFNRLQTEHTASQSEQAEDHTGDQEAEAELDEQNDATDPVDDGESPTNDGDVDDPSNDHLKPHHHRYGRRQLLRDFGQRLLAHFDSDDNGSISEDEVPERLWQRLVDKNIDADANGSISPEEFEDYAAQLRDARFARKDSDENGSLTEDEVRTRSWNKIAEADTNQDGGVTLVELEAWLAARNTEEPEPVDAEEVSNEGEQLDENETAGDIGDDEDEQDTLEIQVPEEETIDQDESDEDTVEDDLEEDEAERDESGEEDDAQLEEDDCDVNEMGENDSELAELRRFQLRSDRIFAQLGRRFGKR